MVSTPVATGGRNTAAVSVTPVVSLEDQPVRILVRGLTAHELVSVAVHSIDYQRTPWMSSAEFHADASGELDLDQDAAVGGSYRGVWGMGLIATMRPTKHSPAGAYYWGGKQRFTLTVSARGRSIASTLFTRRFSPRSVRLEHQPLKLRGFFGEYFAPTVTGTRPAILAIGGSDGGDNGLYLLSALLAAHGYPTLDIAYFNEPGLPQSLSNIPLEYFANALRWLRKQPHVDPNHVVALGVSRGSEASLLLGTHYPDLVHAVIASVPSNVALCSYPGCAGPAWTLRGRPLPYTREFDRPHPTDNPNAVIPVERIRGPVFLDCAGMDQIWTSCAYAHAIMQRLDAHHDRYTHVLYRAPDASHFVGGLLPDEPGFTGNDPANEQAREKLWPHVLAFLLQI